MTSLTKTIAKFRPPLGGGRGVKPVPLGLKAYNDCKQQTLVKQTL